MLDLEKLLNEATQIISKADDLKALDDHRIHYLGKKSPLTDYLKNVGQLPPAERPIAGQTVNRIKQQIHILIEQQVVILQKKQIAEQLASEAVDITLPANAAFAKPLPILIAISATVSA